MAARPSLGGRLVTAVLHLAFWVLLTWLWFYPLGDTHIRYSTFVHSSGLVSDEDIPIDSFSTFREAVEHAEWAQSVQKKASKLKNMYGFTKTAQEQKKLEALRLQADASQKLLPPVASPKRDPATGTSAGTATGTATGSVPGSGAPTSVLGLLSLFIQYHAMRLYMATIGQALISIYRGAPIIGWSSATAEDICTSLCIGMGIKSEVLLSGSSICTNMLFNKFQSFSTSMHMVLFLCILIVAIFIYVDSFRYERRRRNQDEQAANTSSAVVSAMITAASANKAQARRLLPLVDLNPPEPAPRSPVRSARRSVERDQRSRRREPEVNEDEDAMYGNNSSERAWLQHEQERALERRRHLQQHVRQPEAASNIDQIFSSGPAVQRTTVRDTRAAAAPSMMRKFDPVAAVSRLSAQRLASAKRPLLGF